MITRIRLPCDNRHLIRDPITTNTIGDLDRVNLNDAWIWANTLVKTRIPKLFSTSQGLAGHVEQLQNELNRFKISKMEGCNTVDVPHLITIMQFVRQSVKKAKHASTILLPNNLFLEFPLISDKLRI